MSRLRDEFVAGRLSHETFMYRMHAVLETKQQADLPLLLADLPRRQHRSLAGWFRQAWLRLAAPPDPASPAGSARPSGGQADHRGQSKYERRISPRTVFPQPARNLTKSLSAVSDVAPPITLQFPRGGGSQFSIGRDASCDLAIADMTVSRAHATLERTTDGWLLTDLESTNGTRVNGWRVRGQVPVRAGDLVSFGNLETVFTRGDELRSGTARRAGDFQHVLKSLSVTTVLLVRHGLTATTGQLLTGWTPGVGLDERGRAQAKALGERLAPVPLAAIVTSPLQRCRETIEGILAARPGSAQSDPVIDDRVGECKYGDWTGKPLQELEKDPLWPVVQAHPSAVRFPGENGESMLDTQHRAVAAIREWNAQLGNEATYLVCSHGDVIKAIVADAVGLHLDQSQRIVADPCSLTVIRYTRLRPFLLRLNDTGSGVDDLLPRPKPAAGEAGAPGSEGVSSESDAVIGGGAGNSAVKAAKGAEG